MKKHVCDCYIDEDTVSGLMLNPTYKCSKSYLCMHEHSQVAALFSENNLGGFKIRSKGPFPGWGISLIIASIVVLITIFLQLQYIRFSQCVSLSLRREIFRQKARYQ